MNTYIMLKGSHLIILCEVGEVSRISGFRGWLDTTELISLLQGNGYKIVG